MRQTPFYPANHHGSSIKRFFDLNDNDNQPIHFTYSKSGAQLKYFSLSNLLCAYITRLITNHTLIGEYMLKFFPNKSVVYPYSNSLIETRIHILHECVQYIKSWNPKRESFKDVLIFLEFNLRALCFQEGITQFQLSTSFDILPSVVSCFLSCFFFFSLFFSSLFQ